MNRIEELKRRIEQQEQLVNKLDAYQKAFKVVANGGYGAVGNVAFRYFDPAISEAITVTGQWVIRAIANKFNEHLNKTFGTVDVDYVLGSDTDSCLLSLAAFVDRIDPEGKIEASKMVGIVNRFCEDNLEKFLEKEFADMAQLLNARVNTLDMKREAICDWGLYRAKKNYVMRVWDMEHVRYAEPQLKIAGLETQRSDKPTICRDAMRDIIPIFFDGKESDLHGKVKAFRKVFMNADLASIAFPKGVGSIGKYTANGEIVQGKSVPINSRAAIVYNQQLDKHPEIASIYERIKEKDKIKYVYLKMPNPSMSHVIGFKESLPKEFGLDEYVDREIMFEKTFLNPVQSLADLVGWNCVKVEALDDLFE